MNTNKLLNGVKVGLIVLISLIIIALLLHLTMNYLIPFVSNIHNKSGVY